MPSYYCTRYALTGHQKQGALGPRHHLPEDDSHIWKDNGAENFAVLRHIALNLLRRETSAKCRLKGKRKKVAWDDQYLLKVLTG